MFSLKDENKNIKLLLLIICTLFFSLCLFSILKYGNLSLLGNLQNPDQDDVKFIRSAQILASTGKYVYHDVTYPTVFMMPGLSYTLAFFILAFGKLTTALTAFRIFQAILQTLCLLLVFFIGRKIFNSKIAVFAVFLNSIYLPEAWVSNLILTETLFKFFVLNLIYFALYALEKKSYLYYIFGAVSWGLATLYRPTIATFPIVILIMWIIKKYNFKEILKFTIIVSIIFCAILSPWWLRNYNIFHKFIPLTKATGNPFLQGTYINYNQKSKLTDGLNYSQFKYPAETELKNNDVEIEIAKYRLKNLVPRNPLGYVYWYTIGKTACQIGTAMYWVSFLGIHPAFIFLYHYILVICSIIGIKYFIKNKKRNVMGILILASIIYFIIVYLPFFAFSRYFYPAMPLVIIFAASYLSDKLKNSRLKFIY